MINTIYKLQNKLQKNKLQKNKLQKSSAFPLVVTIATLAFTPTVVLAQRVEDTAPESSLVLCETAPITVRVYEANNGLLMRVYDRIQNHVWMDRTPTSVRGTNAGLEYNNELGELSVRVNVDLEDGSCTIQVNNEPAERGTMLRNDTVHSVIGTVTYRERIALPNNTAVSVRLINLETAGPNTVAAHHRVTSGEQVPIPFHIFYFPEEINPVRRYGVVAQMGLESGQQWATSVDYPVLTQTAPFAVEVVVNPGADDATSKPSSPIADGEPLPEAIASAVKAAFTREFGETPFQIDQYSREMWSDGCLGLGGPAESCLAALTEGWQVTIVDLTTNQRYVYRTTLSGDRVRREETMQRSLMS